MKQTQTLSGLSAILVAMIVAAVPVANPKHTARLVASGPAETAAPSSYVGGGRNNTRLVAAGPAETSTASAYVGGGRNNARKG